MKSRAIYTQIQNAAHGWMNEHQIEFSTTYDNEHWSLIGVVKAAGESQARNIAELFNDAQEQLFNAAQGQIDTHPVVDSAPVKVKKLADRITAAMVLTQHFGVVDERLHKQARHHQGIYVIHDTIFTGCPVDEDPKAFEGYSWKLISSWITETYGWNIFRAVPVE